MVYACTGTLCGANTFLQNTPQDFQLSCSHTVEGIHVATLEQHMGFILWVRGCNIYSTNCIISNKSVQNDCLGIYVVAVCLCALPASGAQRECWKGRSESQSPGAPVGTLAGFLQGGSVSRIKYSVCERQHVSNVLRSLCQGFASDCDCVARSLAAESGTRVCPIFLLRISLLSLLDSSFPGNSLWT